MDMDLTAVQMGQIRTQRFSMIVKRNRVIHLNDEAGAQFTEISAADRILGQLSQAR